MFHFWWQAGGFQTYTRTRTYIFYFLMIIKRVCLSVYASFSMTGRGFSNIHTCSAHIFIFWNMRFWACMFERVCLIFDDRQSVFKHTYTPPNASRRWQTFPGALRRSQTHPDASRHFQTLSAALKRSQTLPDAFRRCQILSEAPRLPDASKRFQPLLRRSQTVPDASRRFQTLPDASGELSHRRRIRSVFCEAEAPIHS